MEDFLGLLGRLHPVLVHFPIGILFLAFAFEVASRFRPYHILGSAVQAALLVGTLSAVAAVITGLLLSREGGYPDRLLSLHRLAGISTAVVSCILYILLGGVIKAWRVRGANKRLLLFLPVVLALTITGHLGGSITHGEDYLFAGSDGDAAATHNLRIETSRVDTLALYAGIIQPVFESRCYGCHSSRKIKGDLRLDDMELMLKGGKDGKVILPGNADSSLMLRRLMLPLEDDHHMPPEEKQQLSAAEIDLIRLWINDGVPVTERVGALASAGQIVKLVGLLGSDAPPEWVPADPVSSPNAQAVAALEAEGATVVPVAVGSNYLSITLAGDTVFTAQETSALAALAQNIVRLRLSNAQIGDELAPGLVAMTRLAILYLDDTEIGDETVSAISHLPNLQFLNLVGTLVTDKSITPLSASRKLKGLYVYHTSITGEGLGRLQQELPSLRIDTGGYELPPLPTDTLIYGQSE